MSAVLLDQALAYIRASFTKAEVVTVQEYAGQFNTEEARQVSYNCPAIFVTVLGWKPLHSGSHVSGRNARDVGMAAFVAFKSPKRDLRMRGAMQLAERLAVLLRGWVPDNVGVTPYTVGPIEDDVTCENLYGRAIDSEGQALWLLTWRQGVKPNLAPAALIDWLSVAIEDTARITEPAATATATTPFTVTEKITFPVNT